MSKASGNRKDAKIEPNLLAFTFELKVSLQYLRSKVAQRKEGRLWELAIGSFLLKYLSRERAFLLDIAQYVHYLYATHPHT